MKNKILELSKQVPEIYQDIELKGEIIAKGLRDCRTRWGLVKDQIKPHDVVLDLGSSLGYFSKKIAQTYPDSLVISFESDPIMCQIQVEMFREEGIYNVVVCNYRLGKEDLVKWANYVELFDAILALAVLHHYPKEDLKDVWGSLVKLSNEVICELAPIGDIGACGEESRKESAKLVLKSLTKTLGKVKSHVTEVDRLITSTVDPIKKREALDAFFGVSHPDRHKYTATHDLINWRHIIKGVNVWNLLHFNIVWPLPYWWIQQAKCAYECLDFKSDVRPWNLLVTSTGIKAIDYLTKFPIGDQAEFREDDITKLIRLFSEMKPTDLWGCL